MKISFKKIIGKKAPKTVSFGSAPYGQVFKTSETSGCYMKIVGDNEAIDELLLQHVFANDAQIIPVEGELTLNITE